MKATGDLLDVNVWLAFSVAAHPHHQAAINAWSGLTRPSFCRVTQLGLLRLLTNKQVMGADVLGAGEAWTKYQNLLASGAVYFVEEPAELESSWKPLLEGAKAARDFWTDSYLAAFSMSRQMRLVTFDTGFARFQEIDALILHI